MAEEDKRAENARELVMHLVNLAENRMRADTKLVLCQIDHDWALTESGPASRYTGASYIYIPEDIGRRLSGYWKRNGYGRFTGGRTASEILGLLELVDNNTTGYIREQWAAIVAAQDSVARGQRSQKRAAIRQSAANLLLTVMGLSGELGLDDLDLAGLVALARLPEEE